MGFRWEGTAGGLSSCHLLGVRLIPKLRQVAQRLVQSVLSTQRDGGPLILPFHVLATLWPAQPACDQPSSSQGCSAAPLSRELTVPKMQKLWGNTSETPALTGARWFWAVIRPLGGEKGDEEELTWGSLAFVCIYLNICTKWSALKISSSFAFVCKDALNVQKQQLICNYAAHF